MTAPVNSLLAPVRRVYGLKLHGLRWVNLIGFALVAAMVFSVYVAKAAAAREGARIAELERSIAANGQRVRLLRAEVARLEQPSRLEALSRQIGLVPVDVHRRTDEAGLAGLEPLPIPIPTAPVAPVAADATASSPDRLTAEPVTPAVPPPAQPSGAVR